MNKYNHNIQRKKCSRCGANLPATTEYFRRRPNGKYGLFSWCKTCHATSEEGNKDRARVAVNNAVQDGKLPRVKTLKCAYCDKKAIQYHHHNYAQEHWLDVVPVCRSCHKHLHSEKS